MGTPLVLEFDPKAFSILAVQKACHRFSNVASFEVRLQSSNEKESILVEAIPFNGKSEPGMDHLAKLVRNEALDQQLREKIRAETEGVRNLILAHAFSNTGLIRQIAPSSEDAKT